MLRPQLLTLAWLVLTGYTAVAQTAADAVDPDLPVVAQAAIPGVAVDEVEAADGEVIDPDYWIYVSDRPAHHWLDKKPIDAADLAARPQAYTAALESHGILFDGESGSFSVRGATIHDDRSLGYPIEYLVVTEEGRTHEAVVLVKAQPSMVSACVEALGLAPGSPTRFKLKDPPPSDNELASGLVSPWDMTTAGGPLVSITVSWLDDRGRPHDESLESLLLEWPPLTEDAHEPDDGNEQPGGEQPDDAQPDGEQPDGEQPDGDSGERPDEAQPDDAQPGQGREESPEESGGIPLVDRGWIFTGSTRSTYRQGRGTVEWYRADVEGDVVAIYIDGREVCPFERNSLDGLSDSLYTLNTSVIPPAGTPVSLTFRSLGSSVASSDRVLEEQPEALTGDDQR